MNARELRERQLRVWQLHKDDDNLAISPSEADARLGGVWPAWRLDVDGSLSASNLLALWLWGASIEVDGLNTENFRSKNVFEVFARNFDRIPVSENALFWLAKLRIEREIYGDTPSPFDELRRTSEELKELRNQLEPQKLGSVWRYDLAIGPPAGLYTSKLLEFRTTVRAVESQDGPEGYLALYEPIGSSESIIAAKYRDFVSHYRSYIVNLRPRPRNAGSLVREMQLPEAPKGSVLSGAAVVAMFVLFGVDSTAGNAAASAISIAVFGILVLLGLTIRTIYIGRARRRVRESEVSTSRGSYVFR